MVEVEERFLLWACKCDYMCPAGVYSTKAEALDAMITQNCPGWTFKIQRESREIGDQGFWIRDKV